MGIYDRQIASAKKLIAEKGELCTWREFDATTPDTSKPWNKTANKTDYPVNIVFQSFPRMNYEALHEAKKSDVPAGNKKGLMAQVSFKPTLNAVVIRGNGEIWHVSAIDPIDPNGDVILYNLEFAT